MSRSSLLTVVSRRIETRPAPPSRPPEPQPKVRVPDQTLRGLSPRAQALLTRWQNEKV